MELKKVLYISQEIEPYLPAGNLSTFGRKLAQGIHEGGTEVRTFMPRYSAINERRNQLHEVIRLSGINIIIDDTDHPLIIKVATLLPTRMQVYFIDNDDYFLHHGDGTLETDSMPAVNDERSIFFVRGTVDTVRKLRWDPSVIHCIGWISALAPLYLKRAYADDRVEIFSFAERRTPAPRLSHGPASFPVPHRKRARKYPATHVETCERTRESRRNGRRSSGRCRTEAAECPIRRLLLLTEDTHRHVEDRRIVQRNHAAIRSRLEMYAYALFRLVFPAEIVTDSLYVDTQFVCDALGAAARQPVLDTAQLVKCNNHIR